MIYSHKVTTIRGTEIGMEQFKGKVLLIVNVASECGFTVQYEGLQALYEKYQARGLEVLGFPCNQFGAQESGTDAEIETFCSGRFGVKFPMFAKVDVNGEQAHPLFQELKKAAPGIFGSESIKWNFTKFLVSRDGQVLERFASQTTPADLAEKIEAALA